MNIVMRAKTEEDALWEALESYQNDYKGLLEDYKNLRDKVVFFVEPFIGNDGYVTI